MGQLSLFSNEVREPRVIRCADASCENGHLVSMRAKDGNGKPYPWVIYKCSDCGIHFNVVDDV